MQKCKIILFSLFIPLMSLGQLYTPNSTIQGSSNGNNIGIGNSNPDRPLTIKAINNGNELISLRNTNNAAKWHINLRGGLNFVESGVADFRLFIKTGGNVGIGTENPLAKLDVNGSLVVRGTDFVLGSDNTRSKGSKTAQRALVHELDDKLVINYIGDFEGGTYLHGPKVIFQSDKVGIGTENPLAKLDVNGSLVVRGTDFVLGSDNTRSKGSKTAQRALVHELDDKLVINYAGDFEGGTYLYGSKIIFGSNKVGIGTDNIPTEMNANNVPYHLYVKGGIKTEEVKVELCTGSWCDYVFKDDYNLMPLSEVETCIKEKGHLHNIESAKEIERTGLELKSITINQQEKIEEIFLHLIHLEKQVKKLEEENKKLQTALNKQK